MTVLNGSGPSFGIGTSSSHARNACRRMGVSWGSIRLIGQISHTAPTGHVACKSHFTYTTYVSYVTYRTGLSSTRLPQAHTPISRHADTPIHGCVRRS
jgi:hypothetical protein